MPKKLCQIVIPGNAGLLPDRKYYQCGLNGRFKAHLVGVNWCDRSGATDHKLITIQSDCFRLPYGSYSQSLVIGNRAEHVQSHPAGDFPMDIEIMGNNIDLSFSSSVAYTGQGNHIFEFAILTFTVEPMED